MPSILPERVAVRNRRLDGWHYELGGRCGGPYGGPLEAAAAAEAAAKAGGELGPVQVLWFRLE